MGSGEADTEPGGSSGSCVDGGFEASRRACKALEHLLAQFKCCGCCAHPTQTQRCSWAKPLALPKPISPQQHILLSGIPPSPFHLDTRLTLQTLSWGLLPVVVPNTVVNTFLRLPIAHLLHNSYHAVLNYTKFFCFHPAWTESPKRIVVSQVLGLYMMLVPKKDVLKGGGIG